MTKTTLSGRRTFVAATGSKAAAGLSLLAIASERANAQGQSTEEVAAIRIVDDLIAAFNAKDTAKLKAAFSEDAKFSVGGIGKLSEARTPNFWQTDYSQRAMHMKV